MTERIEIVGVFVTAGDRQHAGAQDVGDTVDDAALDTRIGDAAGEPIRDPQLPLGLPKQQHAAIRRQPAAVERGGDFLRPMAGNRNGSRIVVHGGCGSA